MATKIVTKNSSTASAVPTASDLVQGELAVNVADKRLFTEDNGGAIVELGTNPSGNVTFQDNGKAIFGAGSDLQIYHDGNHSYVSDKGTGDLYLQGSSAIRLTDPTQSENFAVFNHNEAVNLYHDSSLKFQKTSTGVQVSGNISNATGDFTLDVAGNIKLDADSGLVYLSDGGTDIGLFSVNNQDLNIRNTT